MVFELALAFLAGSALSGGLTGALMHRRKKREVEFLVKDNEKLLGDAREVNRQFNEQADRFRNALIKLGEERDQFKQAAASHEVKYQDPPPPRKTVKKVWELRRFAGHPRENLKALRADLEQFKDAEVRCSIKVSFCDGWGKVFKQRQRQLPKETIWKREGPIDRVVEELVAIHKDPDNVYMLVSDEKKGEPHETGPYGEKLWWRDSDSVVFWDIDLEVLREEVPVQPVVHTVEVLRTETKLVEVPVRRTQPEHTPVAPPDASYLAALVEVAVADELSKRGVFRGTAARKTTKEPQPPPRPPIPQKT